MTTDIEALKAELEPCPMCRAPARLVHPANGSRPYVTCTACFVATPACDDPVPRWNRRASTDADPVAYRYVHLDYAGRKVSRYGTHPERVNGHDPIEVHPLYAHPPVPDAAGDALAGAVQRFLADYDDGDRADAGVNPLMEAHIADFRAALAQPPAAEPVPSHEVDADGKPTDDSDPWFQLGWHKERLTEAESELATWKERAMSLRLSNGAAEPLGMREALEKCRDQFQFYADEHKAKADSSRSTMQWRIEHKLPDQDIERVRAEYLKRSQQAETNQRFADMCAAALATGNGGEGRS
jgi:hypothetical protein